MGSSAKKKKDKKKDFQVNLFGSSLQNFSLTFPSQKPKLRVGKTKAKADNFTDTSFKSKCTSLLLTLFSNCSNSRFRI